MIKLEKELDELIVSQLERLYRFAYNKTHDEYKAEDLTQDIILTAARSYHKLKDKNLMLPWLFGIARNVYLRSLLPAR